MTHPPKPCGWKGCTRAGVFAPKICVPARGFAIDCHQPMTAILGLALCDEHVKATTPAVILSDKLRELFMEITRSQGKARPDFDRAWVSPVSLNSNEYKRFEKQQGQNADTA